MPPIESNALYPSMPSSSLLEEQYNLSTHLRSLRRFFLLEHGDFFIQVRMRMRMGLIYGIRSTASPISVYQLIWQQSLNKCLLSYSHFQSTYFHNSSKIYKMKLSEIENMIRSGIKIILMTIIIIIMIIVTIIIIVIIIMIIIIMITIITIMIIMTKSVTIINSNYYYFNDNNNKNKNNNNNSNDKLTITVMIIMIGILIMIIIMMIINAVHGHCGGRIEERS